MLLDNIVLSLKTLIYFYINSLVNGDNNKPILAAPWMATVSSYHHEALMGNNLTYTFGCPSVFIDQQAILISSACFRSYFNDVPPTFNVYIYFYQYRYSVNEMVVSNISSSESINDDLALLIFSNGIWSPRFSNIIYYPMTEEELNWGSCKLIQYPLNSRISVFNYLHINFVSSNECRSYISQANQYTISLNITWSPNLLCSTLFSKNDCLKIRRYSPVVCLSQDLNDSEKYKVVAFSSRRMLTTSTECFALFLNVVSVSSWLHHEIAKLTWKRFLKSISEKEPLRNKYRMF